MLRGVYPERTAEILLPRLRDQDDSEGLSMAGNEECTLSETDLLRYFVPVGLEGVRLGGDFGCAA
jgi:hypothetical protein